MTANATPSVRSPILPTGFLGRVLPLFVVLVLWTGCQRPSSPARETGITGTYALVTVNGKEVPANVSHSGSALQVRSGTFTINEDGTCSSVVVFVPPSGAEVSRDVKATYTLDGSTLTMQWEGAGTTTGTVDGDTFTMNNEGMIFTYAPVH